MALQDLTPQLRTRLSRMERATGWFVLLAALLMMAGLAFYLKVMAERKGWFLQKIYYETCVSSGTGLKVGDPVKLMGFDIGEITAVIPNNPYSYYNITIRFWVKMNDYNYPGYIWSDSQVKVSSELLGGRFLEVTKGSDGVPTVSETTNKVVIGMLKRDYYDQQFKALTDQGKNSQEAIGELNASASKDPTRFYSDFNKDLVYWLKPAESPSINERVEQLVNQVEAALPGITNQIATVLANANAASTNLSGLLTMLMPVATNATIITGNILDPHGSLGEWLIPTNINRQLEGTLTGANTNLPIIAQDLDRMIENLASITSNLNAQVQANSNMLSGISKTVTDVDDMIQGLKKHWLLRSAFKKEPTYGPVPPPSK